MLIASSTFYMSASIFPTKWALRNPPFKRNPYLRDRIELTNFSLKSRFYCTKLWRSRHDVPFSIPDLRRGPRTSSHSTRPRQRLKWSRGEPQRPSPLRTWATEFWWSATNSTFSWTSSQFSPPWPYTTSNPSGKCRKTSISTWTGVDTIEIVPLCFFIVAKIKSWIIGRSHISFVYSYV